MLLCLRRFHCPTFTWRWQTVARASWKDSSFWRVNPGWPAASASPGESAIELIAFRLERRPGQRWPHLAPLERRAPSEPHPGGPTRCWLWDSRGQSWGFRSAISASTIKLATGAARAQRGGFWKSFRLAGRLGLEPTRAHELNLELIMARLTKPRELIVLRAGCLQIVVQRTSGKTTAIVFAWGWFCLQADRLNGVEFAYQIC